MTGGGTSGHVVPALSVLEALEDSGHAAGTLAFVGCRRGVDRDLLEDSGLVGRGVRCAYLDVSGLQRGVTLRSLRRNIVFPARVLLGRRAAARLLRQWHPRVVVSVGGYASDPMSHAATAAGVPLVCVSYDRVPGLATRVQAGRATACAVAFPDSDLPRARHTGAPVRRAFRAPEGADRASARRTLGLPVDAQVIGVVGGSLGSGVLNEATRGLLPTLGRRARGNVAILHLCGPRFADEPTPAVPVGVTYVRRAYETRMADLYAAVDVLVSRAGASTVAEIAATGTPAVIVPWPAAADDHQRLNARWLADNGAAVVLDESLGASLTTKIEEEVIALLDDPERRNALAMNARRLGAPSRGRSLVDLLEECAS